MSIPRIRVLAPMLSVSSPDEKHVTEVCNAADEAVARLNIAR
jgi:hypothetical protein